MHITDNHFTRVIIHFPLCFTTSGKLSHSLLYIICKKKKLTHQHDAITHVFFFSRIHVGLGQKFDAHLILKLTNFKLFFHLICTKKMCRNRISSSCNEVNILNINKRRSQIRVLTLNL